jgi:hypothetical protein
MHRQIHVERGYICATWRNVIINQWVDEITHASLSAGRDAGAKLEAEYGPKIAALTLISPGMPSPSDSVRKEAAEDLKRAAHRIVAAATVIPGTGFRASAFRSAYATLNLFSRTKHPSKVASDVPQAASFIVEELGYPESDAPELVEAVDFYTQALDEFRRAPASRQPDFA